MRREALLFHFTLISSFRFWSLLGPGEQDQLQMVNITINEVMVWCDSHVFVVMELPRLGLFFFLGPLGYTDIHDVFSFVLFF